MATTVDRDQVQRLREDGAIVVEVLPAEEYGLEHLEGAVNIPLEKLSRATVQHIRPDQPIVVYCNDFL
jgi:rhodanese-related sulfurtransferase